MEVTSSSLVPPTSLRPSWDGDGKTLSEQEDAEMPGRRVDVGDEVEEVPRRDLRPRILGSTERLGNLASTCTSPSFDSIPAGI